MITLPTSEPVATTAGEIPVGAFFRASIANGVPVYQRLEAAFNLKRGQILFREVGESTTIRWTHKGWAAYPCKRDGTFLSPELPTRRIEGVSFGTSVLYDGALWRVSLYRDASQRRVELLKIGGGNSVDVPWGTLVTPVKIEGKAILLGAP